MSFGGGKNGRTNFFKKNRGGPQSPPPDSVTTYEPNHRPESQPWPFPALHSERSCPASLAPLPQTIAVSPVLNPVTNTVVLWPSDTAPSVRIVSVDTANVPPDPKANLDVSADVGVVVNGVATVTVQTNNFSGALPTVKVRSAGKFSANAVTTTATFVSGNATQATWQVGVNFVAGFTTLQAIATVQ